MNSSFDKSLALVLDKEGGYSADSRDPGGVTNLGVTQNTLEEWLGHPVTDKTMRELSIVQVAPLYKSKYWMACSAPKLPVGIDYAVFDCAVNNGVGTAVKLFQESLGCVPDGMLGPRTLQLIDQKNKIEMVEKFCERRRDYYSKLKLFPIYGNGWLNRVEFVLKNAIAMIEE